MQNAQVLLDEIFNSGKYDAATIYAYGGIQHRCLIGTTNCILHDGYCELSRTIQDVIDVFAENKNPRTAIETIFLDYSKIIEIQTIKKY